LNVYDILDGRWYFDGFSQRLRSREKTFALRIRRSVLQQCASIVPLRSEFSSTYLVEREHPINRCQKGSFSNDSILNFGMYAFTSVCRQVAQRGVVCRWHDAALPMYRRKLRLKYGDLTFGADLLYTSIQLERKAISSASRAGRAPGSTPKNYMDR
jgi:hypothetical protein